VGHRLSFREANGEKTPRYEGSAAAAGWRLGRIGEAAHRRPAAMAHPHFGFCVVCLFACLVIAGCAQRGSSASSSDDDRRGGFYGGVSGGMTRPLMP
jgi:hypothetical protein